MKKDFNFILYACIAAVLLSLISIPTFLFPRERLFSEDNPLNTAAETLPVESEVENGK